MKSSFLNRIFFFYLSIFSLLLLPLSLCICLDSSHVMSFLFLHHFFLSLSHCNTHLADVLSRFHVPFIAVLCFMHEQHFVILLSKRSLESCCHFEPVVSSGFIF